MVLVDKWAIVGMVIASGLGGVLLGIAIMVISDLNRIKKETNLKWPRYEEGE